MLLHLEGFEGTTTAADVTQRGWSAFTNTGAGFATPRTGLRGLTSNSATLTYVAEAADQHARMFAGAAFQPTATGTGSIAIRDTTSAVVALATLTAAKTLTVTVLGTLRATVSFAAAGLTDLAYNYLEVEALANATTGTVRVWVNGVAVAAASFDGNTGATLLGSAAVSITNNTALDDIYVGNGAAGEVTAPLGDVAVLPLYPTGAGASTQFTPTSGVNWANVDETARSTADLVSSATAGHTDLYTLEDLPATSTAVLGVRVLAYWSKSDAGARTGAIPVRSGGTTSAGPAYALPTTYGYALRMLPVNPVTGVAWTVAEVNALEAGVQVAA